MPEFVVFAVAASMCVLCFAVGFIAALNVRIVERTAPPLAGAGDRNDDSAPRHAEAVQTTVTTTAFAPVPTAHAAAISLPRADRAFEPQSDIAPAAATPPPLPQRTHAGQPVGFPPPASPPAKVFLFGEPHGDAVVGPELAPVHPASPPNRWATTQHGAPQQLAPAQVELLPHRPQYARSGRRR